MVHGLLGNLPWFAWLGQAYGVWDDHPNEREQLIQQVKEAKIQFLEEGWVETDGTRRTLPDELGLFIRICGAQEQGVTFGKPNYSLLAELLGGIEELDLAEAETLDLQQFAEEVSPML